AYFRADLCTLGSNRKGGQTRSLRSYCVANDLSCSRCEPNRFPVRATALFRIPFSLSSVSIRWRQQLASRRALQCFVSRHVARRAKWRFCLTPKGGLQNPNECVTASY